MVAGEKSFTTEGRQVKKMDFAPLPNGDYDFKVLGSTADIRKGTEPKSVPYVTVALEALGTAIAEGGKNRRVYHNFHLSLVPGNDGAINIDRPNGLTLFSKAIGEAFVGEDETVTTLDGTTVQVVKAEDVKRWLQSKDGMIVRAHTKVKTSKGYPDKAEISYFIEGEGSSTPS